MALPSRANTHFLEVVPEGTEAHLWPAFERALFEMGRAPEAREIHNLLKGIERHQSGFMFW
jgi:hypothetical protein